MEVGSQLPIFQYLLRPAPKCLTFKSIVQLLKPEFGAEGSNSRRCENAVYTTFQKYLREVASKPSWLFKLTAGPIKSFLLINLQVAEGLAFP